MFDINNIALTILNYDISYVELIGTITGLISVILAGRNKVSNYPIGIINIIFFFILFYQIQLYSDMFEQAYYFVVSILGWYLWLNPKKDKDKTKENTLRVTNNTLKENIIYGIILIVTSIALGMFMKNINVILPKIFTSPASYPYLDSFTTMLSLIAMYMLAKRKIENWYLWIIVNVIAVVLYFVKGVKLLSIEYFIFLINAIISLRYWYKVKKSEEKEVEQKCLKK